MAIAVPGEVRGFYEAWKQFGLVPWYRLIQPSIDLCYHGFEVPKALAYVIEEKIDQIKESETLRLEKKLTD